MLFSECKPSLSLLVHDIVQPVSRVIFLKTFDLNLLFQEIANLTKEAIVKTTVFLKDIADFPVMNQLYGEYFSSLPARSAFQVAALPNEGLIEIEIIATR